MRLGEVGVRRGYGQTALWKCMKSRSAKYNFRGKPGKSSSASPQQLLLRQVGHSGCPFTTLPLIKDEPLPPSRVKHREQWLLSAFSDDSF